MTQQVNLYQPILRQQQKVFSAGTMARLLGAITVLMLLMYAFSYWQLARLEDENRQLRAQQAELAARLVALSGNARARSESAELRSRAEAAERELELKQKLAALLRDRPLADGSGFSDAFAGLARQRIGGLWLTGVSVKNAGPRREVTLRGYTAQAELVPQLVQRLGAEPAFQGMQFRGMRVFQPEDAAIDALAFELSTEPRESAP